MPLRPLLSAIAGLLVAATIVGCGLGLPNTPSGVKMLVTEDFGSTTLLSVSAPKAGLGTAIGLLMRNVKVLRQHRDGAVKSIDGHSGGEQEGRPTGWFYYVDGEEASIKAAERAVHAGDRIWWDLHDGSQSQHVPAVVGSFPAPFQDGLGGKRLPVVLECAKPGSSPCHTISHRFTALGIVAGFAALGTVGEGSEEDDLKVLVGTWAQLASSPAVRTIEKGPALGGVYMRATEGGRGFALLGRDGSVTATLGGGAGLVAATRYSGAAPVWVVTGTDAAGVRRAAANFDAASLDRHFAIAVEPSESGTAGRVIALPDTSR